MVDHQHVWEAPPVVKHRQDGHYRKCRDAPEGCGQVQKLVDRQGWQNVDTMPAN